jgi:hypothetical protein
MRRTLDVVRERGEHGATRPEIEAALQRVAAWENPSAAKLLVEKPFPDRNWVSPAVRHLQRRGALLVGGWLRKGAGDGKAPQVYVVDERYVLRASQIDIDVGWYQPRIVLDSRECADVWRVVTAIEKPAPGREADAWRARAAEYAVAKLLGLEDGWADASMHMTHVEPLGRDGWQAFGTDDAFVRVDPGSILGAHEEALLVAARFVDGRKPSRSPIAYSGAVIVGCLEVREVKSVGIWVPGEGAWRVLVGSFKPSLLARLCGA